MDAARVLARLGREGDAFEALAQAVECGWSDPVALEREADLAGLRARPEASRLLPVVAERSRLSDEPSG